jgi:hemerythrin
MAKGAAKDVMGKILDELVNYTKTHFAQEEKYFDQFKYPEVEKHKNEHTILTTKAVALQTEFKSGKTALSIQTMNFLKDWLTNHIMVSDKAYSSFLIGKGVQ